MRGLETLRRAIRPRRTAPPRWGVQPDPRTCEAPGCFRATAEHKPVCLEHLAALDYPAQVAAELERRAAEQARAAAEGPSAVALDGTLAEDVRGQLRDRGCLTVAALADRLDLHVDAAASIAQALADAGEARILRSRDARRTGPGATARLFVELRR